MKLSDYIKLHNIELSDEQVSKLNEMLGVIESKVWKPKNNEWYYFINHQGQIDKYLWENSFTDIELFGIGNVFKTRKQAEFEVEKRKLIVELDRFADENNDEIDWENYGQYKYYIVYDIADKEIMYMSARKNKAVNDVYFTSKKLVEQAIDKFGKRINKYLFGVDEPNPLNAPVMKDAFIIIQKDLEALEILKKRINQNVGYYTNYTEKEVHIHFTITGDEINKINEWLEVKK